MNSHVDHSSPGYLSKSLTNNGFENTERKYQHGTSVDSLLAGDGIDGGQQFTTREMGTLLRSPSGGHLYYNDEDNITLTPAQRLDGVLCQSSQHGKIFYLSAKPRPAHHNKGRAPSPPPRHRRGRGDVGTSRSSSYDGVLTEAEQVAAETGANTASTTAILSTEKTSGRQSRSITSHGSLSRSKSEGARSRAQGERSPSPQVPPRHKKHAKMTAKQDPPVYIPAPDYNEKSGNTNKTELHRTRKPSSGSGGYFSAESDYSYDHSRSNSANSNDESKRNLKLHIHTIEIGSDEHVYEVKHSDLNRSYESNWERMLDNTAPTVKQNSRNCTPEPTLKLQKSLSPPSMQGTISSHRSTSSKPPTYEEALNRMSWVHDKSLAQQAVKDMSASLMYQESLRQYERENAMKSTNISDAGQNISEIGQAARKERPHSTSNIQIPDGTYRAVPVHRSNSDKKYRSQTQRHSKPTHRPTVSDLTEDWKKIKGTPTLTSVAEGIEKPVTSLYTRSASVPYSKQDIQGTRKSQPVDSRTFYYGMEDDQRMDKSKGNKVVINVDSSERSHSVTRKDKFYYGMDEKTPRHGDSTRGTVSEYGGYKQNKDKYYYGMEVQINRGSQTRARTGTSRYGYPPLSVSELRNNFERKSTRSECAIPPYKPWKDAGESINDSRSEYKPSRESANVYYTYTPQHQHVLQHRKLNGGNPESYV